MLATKIEQEQNNLFEFPLEVGIVAINKIKIERIDVKDKIVIKEVPLTQKSSEIIADPNLSLLFEGEVNKEK